MPVRSPIKTPGKGPTGPGGRRPRIPVSHASGLGGWVPPDPALGSPAYVRKSGSDSNGGTSPADAWLTVNHAAQTAALGSTVYIGAGVYRETVNVTITPTASLPVAFVGDVDGSFTGDAGMVQLTAYTTSDTAAPSATTLLNLSGSSNLTFQNIAFVQGNAILVTATTATSTGVTFRDCSFAAGRALTLGLVSVTSAFGRPLNWTFDRCYFMCGSVNGNILVNCTLGVGPDYDVNVVIRNSVFVAGDSNVLRLAAAGAGAGKGNGIHVWNCSFFGPILNSGANISTQFPSTVYNCFCHNPTTTVALVASSSGMIVEDYNLLAAGSTVRTNVTAGAHSVSDGSYAPLVHFGQERVWGGSLRPFGEPLASSPLSRFGNDGSQTPYDARNGPRPAGILAPAVGAYERGNNFAKETGTVHTGSNAISIVGDGFQDFDFAVDAGTVTVSVYCQTDTNYTGEPPRLQILPNQEVGVGDPYDAADAAGVGAFEQLQVTIHPTAAGVVTARVIASDTSGTAETVFDTWSIA